METSDSTKFIEVKITELKNVLRLIQNNENIINEVSVKGQYCGAVAEVQGWLAGFKQSVSNQIKTLESTLPKVEVLEAEIVK